MTIPGVVLLGVALLVIGWLTGIGILWILGVIALVCALALFVLSLTGTGRRRTF